MFVWYNAAMTDKSPKAGKISPYIILHTLNGVEAQDLRFTPEQAQSLPQTFLDLGSEEGDSPSPRIPSVYELRNLYI